MARGRLAGKIALVSGAGRGIGEAIARCFHGEGATVIVTDLNPQGRAVADDLGDNARFILLDATDEAAWDAVLDEVLQHYGRLDILVNNAGGSAGAGPFESYTLDMHRREIDLNLTSTWLGSRCALRAMARPDARHRPAGPSRCRSSIHQTQRTTLRQRFLPARHSA